MPSPQSFEMEEFVNFTISDTEDTQESPEVQDWTSYPDLFKPAVESSQLINFEGASLIEEEYVDPFASLKQNTKEEFLKKLKSRRLKLEQMAKSLSSKIPHKWELDMKCKETKMEWYPQVQAYYFTVSQVQVEQQLATSMLHLFQSHLLEYLL